MELKRRNLMKTVGAASTAVIGAGALGLASMSASAADSFTISDASPVTTVDGTVQYVEVDATHKVAWEGFDEPVAAVAYRDVLEHTDGTTHVLYDNTGSPVRLADYSSKDVGDDGWGGPDEYASEDPSSYVQATGPTKEGFVHAGIVWRVLDDGGDDANSAEDPAALDTFGIEEPTDGETNTTTLTHNKTVSFYKEDGNGGLVQMGSADGTLADSASSASFDVTVTNEESTSDSDGDGTSSTGT